MPTLLRPHGFVERLEQARLAGHALIDLTEADPSRCGLTWNPAELDDLLAGRSRELGTGGMREAREAVSSYLAGRGASVDPSHVFFSSSAEELYSSLLKLLCQPDDEVLVASPSRPFLDAVAEARSVSIRSYPLVYDGYWRLDRKSLRKIMTRRTRAIIVGNPSDPTGAMLAHDDMVFLEDVCSQGELALVGDETFLDTALAPCPSVGEAKQCLAFHVSGLSGVCGLPQLHVQWMVAAGPDALVTRAVSSFERPADPGTALSAIPALLPRRERFLSALRSRLAENRSYLAAAALREAPWSLQWGGGGCWAVLQIGAAEEEEPLCLALLEDGVAVQPGFLHGLPRNGFLVVSLLPSPVTFREGLSRLDRRLRGPLLG